eukprot:CAMPEP_0119319844 /NCGR_PEP_ID=MMETSP1333-20130426/50496_1 /TAXON_ID=418940 /ORGANISM="Scyphosphaera apsteinii, Strain RCC1455" /LENGTH=71 /DNA_ID=CAMNT_0007326359 /DNA_START=223 /DNA_END=438 /DNA_ORIENTATION=-
MYSSLEKISTSSCEKQQAVRRELCCAPVYLSRVRPVPTSHKQTVESPPQERRYLPPPPKQIELTAAPECAV